MTKCFSYAHIIMAHIILRLTVHREICIIILLTLWNQNDAAKGVEGVSLRPFFLFVASVLTCLVWCALVPGGSRLLATDPAWAVVQAEEGQPEQTPRVPPVFCLAAGEPAPKHPQADAAARLSVVWEDCRRVAEVAAQDALRSILAGLPCDANGNVLRHDRYIQAVYRAFSLGDAGG